MDQKQNDRKTFISANDHKPEVTVWDRKHVFGSLFLLGKKLSEKKVKRKIVKIIIIRSHTKVSPGQMDAKVQICLQTQTLCRLETGMDALRCSGNGRGGSISTPQSRESTTSISWYSSRGLLDLQDAIVSREHICSLCNVRRTAGSSSVVVVVVYLTLTNPLRIL